MRPFDKHRRTAFSLRTRQLIRQHARARITRDIERARAKAGARPSPAAASSVSSERGLSPERSTPPVD